MLIRVFPRKTAATPTDDLSRVNCGPMLWDEADEVHVSVAFREDIPRAEWLAEQWRHVAPVKVGGPAFDDRGGEFVPGRYIKPGYVITSRGCPNRCWFCDAWKREGNEVRELPITEGYNLLDNNILACSDAHQEAIFAMLAQQKHRPMFTGGLEAARFTEHHAAVLLRLKPETFFFAYDTPDDWDPLVEAARVCRHAGLIGPNMRHTCRAYVLIGYRGDTMEKAAERLEAVCRLHIMPEAMLYDLDNHRKARDGWAAFQREWNRAAIVGKKMREVLAA